MKKHTKTLKKKLKNFNPKLKEECGVFGISNIEDASALTALGLHALQHRGQEGCGRCPTRPISWQLHKLSLDASPCSTLTPERSDAINTRPRDATLEGAIDAMW